MKVQFLTFAQQQVDDAYHWFEKRTEGKGLEFIDELDRVIQLIRTFPFAAMEIEHKIRRTLLARFPYAIVYGIDEQTIVGIAVAHIRRRPRYWVDRTIE